MSNFKDTASMEVASFDVDADAGIGFICIVDVVIGIHIVTQALVHMKVMPTFYNWIKPVAISVDQIHHSK